MTLGRFVAVWQRFFLLMLPAVGGFFALTAGNRPAHLSSSENVPALEKSAEAYLRQTSRLLAGRYDESFYRSAVRAQTARLLAARDPEPSDEEVPLDIFTELESEGLSGAAEAIAFLEEVDSSPVLFPTDTLHAGGNPVNAFADRLIGRSPSPADGAGLRSYTEFPWFGSLSFLFSLFTVLIVPFTSASPLPRFWRTGFETAEKFFAALRKSGARFLCQDALLKRLESRKPLPLGNHTAIGEKKTVVLLV